MTKKQWGVDSSRALREKADLDRGCRKGEVRTRLRVVAAKFYGFYGCDNLPRAGFRADFFRFGALGMDRGVVFEKPWSRSRGARRFWHYPSRNADSARTHRWIHLFDGFGPLRSA